ncbi:uncharacterized protein F5147DRAFT_124610 [Suillus discolor]|uniref:Uncharacterized protein n=1 Tax=Suillus discolor TaxID=1912936 RepID=A0A9P7FJ33_9AGAM|nr:uncharacterized protein F5147DRAFT_124610 [Suillus discolor]KAG2119909.1 hypothetical protein F5147DRAFT_124610 [Suillus discolor]
MSTATLMWAGTMPGEYLYLFLPADGFGCNQSSTDDEDTCCPFFRDDWPRWSRVNAMVSLDLVTLLRKLYSIGRGKRCQLLRRSHIQLGSGTIEHTCSELQRYRWCFLSPPLSYPSNKFSFRSRRKCQITARLSLYHWQLLERSSPGPLPSRHE